MFKRVSRIIVVAIPAFIAMLGLMGLFTSPKPANYSRYVVAGTGDTTLVFPNIKSDVIVENLGSNRARYSLHSNDSRRFPGATSGAGAWGDTLYVIGAGDTHLHENAGIKRLILHRAASTDILVLAKD